MQMYSRHKHSIDVLKRRFTLSLFSLECCFIDCFICFMVFVLKIPWSRFCVIYQSVECNRWLFWHKWWNRITGYLTFFPLTQIPILPQNGTVYKEEHLQKTGIYFVIQFLVATQTAILVIPSKVSVKTQYAAFSHKMS